MSDVARRTVLRLAGLGLVGMGTVGIVVPLWPSTCFYLGAIWCFARSAPTWVERLYRAPGIGPALRAWVETGTVPTPILRRTALVLWTGLALSWLALRPGPLVSGLLVAVGCAVSLHLWHLARRAARPHCRYAWRVRSPEERP